MTTEEIGEKLRAAFPGKLVSFTVEVEVSCSGTIRTMVHLYHSDCCFTDCVDLDDGMRLVQARLEKTGPPQPGKPFTIEIGGNDDDRRNCKAATQ